MDNFDTYILEMFPYPSGDIHMGHVRNYSIGDAIARYHEMKGAKVLHPMGWDAFGLPAENAAIERGIHPAIWTKSNIANMKTQIQSLDINHAWECEFATCDSSYYKHEQKMFIDFFHAGLAYKKESFVNWDPVDNTVLANEQVVDGRGWRSGAIVEKRKLSQWFLKVTDYAEDLISELSNLDWPDKIKIMQKNWIGKSTGCEINFQTNDNKAITVFTTRPETIFGASFLAISPEHELAQETAKTNQDLQKFIDECRKSSTMEEDVDTAEKLGLFTGKYAVHPFNKTQIPIWVANFVLTDYGTGALFGCPAHDQRDFEFATKYSLPIRNVISQNGEILETDEFFLRPFVEGDRPAFYTWCKESDALVDDHNKKPEWKENAFNRFVNSFMKNGFAKFAVIHKMTGDLAGYAGFENFYDPLKSRNPLKTNNEIEIGYRFHKKFCGRGVASDITKALCSWFFKNFPAEKIIAVTDPKNLASERVLDKSGFKKISTTNNEWGEENFFCLNREEFLQILYLAKISTPHTAKTGIMVNSGFLNGLSVEDAFAKVIAEFESQKKGRAKISYRLRDWGVSRQRYWGCPIPIVYCDSCGVVPETNLPVFLPEDAVIKSGENPLKTHPTWKHCACPKCGKPATRETDTLDTFFESSWYFLRFCSPNADDPFDETAIRPVDIYIGGAEHACMHLLYARFFIKALRTCGYKIPFSEPFKKLINQGMVCHQTFQKDGKWLSPKDAQGLDGVTVGPSIKMSKSKKNIIDPEEIISKYGADAARLFMLSDTPQDRDFDWDAGGIESSAKFLIKLRNVAQNLKNVKPAEPNDMAKIHEILQGYIGDMSSYSLNKAIARIRELSNFCFSLEKAESAFVMPFILKLLYPFCPKIAYELWNDLNCQGDFPDLPKVDTNLLEKATVNITCQINGKMRGIIIATKNMTQNDVIQIAINNEKLSKYITGDIQKIIFVPNKVLSLTI